MVNMGEVFAYERLCTQPMELVPLSDAEIAKFSLKAGDLLFARQSLVLEGAGKCSLVLNTHEITTFESHLIRVRLDPSLANSEFYFNYFRSYVGKSSIASLVMQVAAAGIRGSELAKLPVPYPPLRVQRRISTILSAYDDLIENNTQRIRILEEMAQRLYREWFVNFRFPGHEKVRMVESELGQIPEGWAVQPLSKLCSKVIDGTHDTPPPVKEGFPLVTGKHFTSGFIDFDACYHISLEEHEKVMRRSKPEPGDILFSNIGTLGSIAIVPNQPQFSIKNVALFKPCVETLSTFLFVHFSLPETIQVLYARASGTSQKFWSLEFLRTLIVGTPDATLLARFNELLKPALSLRSVLHNQRTNLTRTRDLLLPKLISGEIPVEAVEETATELAEQTA
jgi:type I restriction enzyme S subunit